jgi:lipopolysaccharide/colanic/teichoic acid biosynthesis glycosyltransferase
MERRTRDANHALIETMRRTIDIFVSLLVLTLLSPLLLVIAVWTVIDSPGSPIYRAPRVGSGGRLFRMWKFRTMVRNAARVGPPITGRNDPRVTRLGRRLRRLKLDELPQFVNVLLGDMTLVGPRPEAPEMVALYTVEQRAVLDAKPGVTGRVQLQSDSEEATIPEGMAADEYYVRHLMGPKLRLDLEYLRSRTAGSDALIVLASAALILRSAIHK